MIAWDAFARGSFDPFAGGEIFVPERDPRRPVTGSSVLAARVEREPSGEGEARVPGVNAIFVADVDLISDLFFNLRDSPQALERGLSFDNIAFVLNAVDVLAGDEAYLPLRRRKRDRRTLEAVEAKRAEFLAQQRSVTEAAQQELDDSLEAARERFQKQRDALDTQEGLSPQAREQLIAAAAQEEDRRLAIADERLRRDLRRTVDEAEREKNRREQATETRFRYLAWFLPPLPAIALGLGVLLVRLLAERRHVEPGRAV